MVAGTNSHFQAQKLKAADVFVDREEPKALFTRTAQDFASSRPAAFRLLAFYGAGGQGKTALCNALFKLLDEEPLKTLRFARALIDLHANKPGDYIQALVTIRNAIAGATGARFACFDLAVADYHDQLGVLRPHMVIGASRLHGFLADAGEGVREVVVEGLKAGVGEFFSEAVGGVPFVGPSIKRMSKWAFAQGTEAYLRSRSPVLQRLYGGQAPSPPAIRLHLADILAHEFALWMRDRKRPPLALFIDEYENALPAGGSKLSLHASSEWDDALREFISACATGAYAGNGAEAKGYRYDAGFLLLIFGREKLRWDQIDAGWKAEMQHQHALGGLADGDALGFLEQVEIVEEPIRAAIVEASRAPDPQTKAIAAYPMMLDLGVQIYFDLKSRGASPTPADFAIDGNSYSEKRRSLLARYLRNFREHEGFEALLRRLACVREFDRALAVQLADRFARSFDRAYFDDLTALTFVGPAEDGVNWIIHSHISETLLSSLPQIDLEETHAWLAQWFKERATPPSTKLMTLDHAEALGDAIVHHAHAHLPVASFREEKTREVLFWPAAVSRLRPGCERAVAISRRRSPPDALDLAHYLSLTGSILLVEEKFQESENLLEEALAIRERLLPADHLDRATSLRDLGILRYHQQRHGEASELFRRAYEIRAAKTPFEARLVLTSLHDLAVTSIVMNDADEAERLFAEALELSRTCRDDHPIEAAHLLYNIAWYRNAKEAREEAAELLADCLRLREEVLPADHKDVLEGRRTLAQIEFDRGRFDASEEQARMAFRLTRDSTLRKAEDLSAAASLLVQACAGARRAGAEDDHGSPAPLPRLYSASWTARDPEFDAAVLRGWDEATPMAADQEAVSFTEMYRPQAIRYLDLPFWTGEWLLCECEVAPALLHGLWDGARLIIGDGNSIHVHARNAKGIDLSTTELRLAYLAFFCSWIRAPEGRFAVIRHVDDLASFVPDSRDRARIMTLLEPVSEEEVEPGAWKIRAPTVYGRAFDAAEYLLRSDGTMEMAQSETIQLDPPLRPEVWVGPYRFPGTV